MSPRDALLRSRCTARDWEIWTQRAKADAVWSQTAAHARRVQAASLALQRFCDGPRGYIGVSWGKDSCAVLLMALRLDIDWPIAHVVIEPVQNPDCATTRDAWLALYPELRERYHEIVIRCVPKPSTGRYDTNRAYSEGFAACARRLGSRRVSGVRAEESGARDLTVRRNGLGGRDSSTARPIGRWTSEDVFALLRDHPLAPAYPCTLGGAYERGRVRLNNLWGLYGEGHGRREWEEAYYPEALREIRHRHATDSSGPRD